jgi:transcriptional regulator with XRE-family HTH domain
MVDTIRTKRHKALVRLITAQRKEAGILQTELAEKLGRSQTWVARLEGGGRRIDVIEFLALAEVIGFDPERVLRKLMKTETELFK